MGNSNKHIILQTDKLSIGYRSRKKDAVVASDINISLRKGELTGLVGANGIGKSTLLRTLTKVQPSLGGRIQIAGKALSEMNPVNLAQVMSLVLTESVVSKNLSVYELVALGRQPYTNWIGNLTETDRQQIDQAMQQTHIGDMKHKKCYELSDGQLQKVMIARALAQDTDLIILDEPTTHLDMYHKAYILKLLQKLVRNTNKAILFSSHEIDLAIQLCDTLMVMTGEGVISASPENHIKQGNFNTLFPRDLIAFDPQTGSFRVNK